MLGHLRFCSSHNATLLSLLRVQSRGLQKERTALFHATALRSDSSIPVMMLADIEGTGVAGEIVRVKRGFARNFLIPRKKATYLANKEKFEEFVRLATIDNAAKLERIAAEHAERIQALKAVQSIEMTATATSWGRLYAAISPTEIAAKIAEKSGVTVKDSDIKIDEAVKNIGEHTVTALGTEITVNVRETEKIDQ